MRKRLEFIEFFLYWERKIGRKQLQDQFNISPQQASVDLNTFRDFFPESMVYDPREKSYLPTQKFKPKLARDIAKDFLRQLESVARGFRPKPDVWIQSFPEHDMVSVDYRPIKGSLLQTILTAIKKQQCLEATYVSLTSTSTGSKKLFPTAIANDGHRWHLRAYNLEKKHFSDYVISRIAKVSKIDFELGLIPKDHAWEDTIVLVLEPEPNLPDQTKEQLELEYEMKDGQFSIKIRKAMLFYYLRHYGFNPYHIVNGVMENRSSFKLYVKNLKEVETCLMRRS